jgi:anti-sigma factor RsiW
MDPCPQIPSISAYHDGELSAERQGHVEQHLLECARCSAELASLKRLSARVAADAPVTTLSPDAMRRFHRHVDQMTDRSLLRFAELLTGLAAAVLVAATLWAFRPVSVSAEPVPHWQQAAVMLLPEHTGASPSPIRTAEWLVTELAPDGPANSPDSKSSSGNGNE